VQELLRLLSDPTRVRILIALEPGELAVHELADVLGMAQPRISNHLRLLRNGGALRARREGGSTFYRNALGEHPRGATLWQAVREGLATDARVREDAARRREVLERRRRLSRRHFSGANGHALSFEHGTLREEMLAALVPRNLVVVDGGCGDGFLTEALTGRFARVLAFDHSPERLVAARARVQAGDVSFEAAELDDLPLRAGSADVCFLSMVLHHVPEIDDVLREAARVLRPGGRIVIADLAPHEEESLREQLGDLRLGLDPADLAKSLAAAGFVEVRFLPVRDRLVAGRGRNLDLILATGEHPGPARRPRNRKPNTRRREP